MSQFIWATTTEWFINNKKVLFTVPEAGSPRPRYRQILCLVRALLLVQRVSHLSLCPHMVKWAKGLSGSLL